MADFEPGAERQTWETRLAALEGELASQPLEGLSDVLRLGEKLLAAAGVDLRAGSDTFLGTAKDVSEIAARMVRVRESVAAAGTARRSGDQPHGGQQPRSAAPILKAQGMYYVVSGLWAVVDRPGFERVTGRKTDYWLVRTVGLLAAGIGLTLLLGARGGRPSSETSVLGVAAGASFAAVDLVYVARRRISPVYLADVGVHGLLAVYALSERSSQSRRSS